MKAIYLDHNATTPIDKRVADAMRPYFEEFFGNPSSTHSYGTKTKMAVEYARQQVAALINCEPSEIVFTSGGTEANNFAMKGIAYAKRNKGNHIITSAVEHPAVFEVCRYLEKQGFEVSYLPVDKFGMIDHTDVIESIKASTILISIMHANNEVGTIQPVEEIGAMARKMGIVFHTDAAQSVGKIETDVKKLNVDLMSIAGHKLYAPKGVGALYIRNGIHPEKLIHGADHEQNLRAGTENVLELVGLGTACEIARKEMEQNTGHYLQTRDLLHDLLIKGIPEARLNGHPEKRLPNTLSLSFPGVEANTLVSRLEGVAVSAGAACHSESIDVSKVLEAMHVPIEFAMGTIRFSTGRNNSVSDIKKAAKEVISLVRELMPHEAGSRDFKQADSNEIKLTKYTHGLGCACKIQPQKLEKILASLPYYPDRHVLVGTETSDDATVYKIADDYAIVQSLDFFTPIVDDPYQFGAIAAANALSDIYAMGATPLFGMNIVAFPEEILPLSVLEKILKGAHEKAHEAGIPIVGGHTIEDTEPKYGMVVSGYVHPDRIIRNVGLKPGDQLVLTKALGTGILSTALKRGLLNEETRKSLLASMAGLNKSASELMLQYDVHACTDITGFGLMGHLLEMNTASKTLIHIYFDNIPFLSDVKALAVAGSVPGGSYNNLEYVSKHVDFGDYTRIQRLMVCDAQTSGGLLIALPEKQAEKLVQDCHNNGLAETQIIGDVTDSAKGFIRMI